MSKLSPTNFVKKYYRAAMLSELENGLSTVACLAQMALETGWNESVSEDNYNLFGIKADKNWKGEKQLCRTFEILSTDNRKFPKIYSITPLANGKYEYVVDDWFRVYDSPEQSIRDRMELLFNLPRYSKAWAVRHDYVQFFYAIEAAGYATGKNYAKTLISIGRSVEKIIEREKLEVFIRPKD